MPFPILISPPPVVMHCSKMFIKHCGSVYRCTGIKRKYDMYFGVVCVLFRIGVFKFVLKTDCITSCTFFGQTWALPRYYSTGNLNLVRKPETGNSRLKPPNMLKMNEIAKIKLSCNLKSECIFSVFNRMLVSGPNIITSLYLERFTLRVLSDCLIPIGSAMFD